MGESSNRNAQERYAEYPVFKGLQRPLEFMGLQGRYIFWAAGAIGGAIIGFIVAYCLIGLMAGDTLHLKAPFGDWLYGKEVERSFGDAVHVKMEMRSARRAS